MGSIPCQEIFLIHILLKKRNIARKLIFGSAVGIISKFLTSKNQIFKVLYFYLLDKHIGSRCP